MNMVTREQFEAAVRVVELFENSVRGATEDIRQEYRAKQKVYEKALSVIEAYLPDPAATRYNHEPVQVGDYVNPRWGMKVIAVEGKDARCTFDTSMPNDPVASMCTYEITVPLAELCIVEKALSNSTPASGEMAKDFDRSLSRAEMYQKAGFPAPPDGPDTVVMGKKSKRELMEQALADLRKGGKVVVMDNPDDQAMAERGANFGISDLRDENKWAEFTKRNTVPAKIDGYSEREVRLLGEFRKGDRVVSGTGTTTPILVMEVVEVSANHGQVTCKWDTSERGAPMFEWVYGVFSASSLRHAPAESK
jgi:hypothetical protein